MTFLWWLSKPLKTVVVLGQVWIEACHCRPVVQKQPSPGCEIHSVLTKIEFPIVVCDFCSQTSEGLYGDANFMGPHSSFLEALDQNSAFMPCSEAKARFQFRILWHLQQVYLPPRRHLTCFFFSALWDAKPCWIAFLISIPNTFSSRRA